MISNIIETLAPLAGILFVFLTLPSHRPLASLFITILFLYPTITHMFLQRLLLLTWHAVDAGTKPSYSRLQAAASAAAAIGHTHPKPLPAHPHNRYLNDDCAICRFPFTDPVDLPCGHVYCARCTELLFANDPNRERRCLFDQTRAAYDATAVRRHILFMQGFATQAVFTVLSQVAQTAIFETQWMFLPEYFGWPYDVTRRWFLLLYALLASAYLGVASWRYGRQWWRVFDVGSPTLLMLVVFLGITMAQSFWGLVDIVERLHEGHDPYGYGAASRYLPGQAYV